MMCFHKVLWCVVISVCRVVQSSSKMDCGIECEEEDVVKSFQSTTSLPGKKREATLLPSLHLIQMEYFRRLLGALQETLVSTPAFN